MVCVTMSERRSAGKTLALRFHDVQFSVVDRDGQPWVTARQLAQALGYAREDSVLKIYERNKEEFSPMMSVTVKMTVGITEIPVRIFSMRGCWLVSMLSRTSVAKEFRKWVLDVLDRLAQEEGKRAEEAITSHSLESVLQRIYTLPAGRYEKATKDERHPIDHARKAWVAAAAANGRVIQHSDSWKIIRGHFGNITRIDDLPAAWVMDAVRFCQEMLAHETMVKIREERELEERAERRATAALPAPTLEPAQSPLPVSVAQLDIAGIEMAMEETTRRQLAYSEAVFNLMNKVRAPFWEREGRQASPALKGLMQAMARGLGDMQMTAAHAHNAVIASAAIAVEGCKLLADEGRA